MMRFIEKLRARYRWHWVGTVEGENLDAGRSAHMYWNLYQRGDGSRKFKQEPHYVELKYSSVLCRRKYTQIVVWKNGGPVPELYASAFHGSPRGKLSIINGGKGGAA